MKQIIFIMKYTYKKIITTKSIWFTMLMPVVLLVIISLVSKAQNTGNPAVVTSITPDQAKNFATQVLPRILTIFLYMVIITNSSVIATEIARDKGSKLLEFIFSSIDAKKYFYGRILGSILVVFTNILVWAVFIAGFITYSTIKGDAVILAVLKNGLNISSIIMILIFWVFGIIIYMVIAGALGAIATKAEDAGKTASPIIMIGVICYILSIMPIKSEILKNGLALFPLSSPFFIPRAVLEEGSNSFIIAGSFLILFLTILVSIKLTADGYKKMALNYNPTKIHSFLYKNKRKYR